MSESLNILTPLFAIIGIIIGATIQSYYARKVENKKQVLYSKTNAYVDYLECMSQSAYLDRNNEDELTQLLARAANAKTRICVYGSKDVIIALTAFEVAGANIYSKENAKIFVRLCSEMRKDHLDEGGEELLRELQIILVGKEHW
jgi:hypothetical protein